ncbi:DUF397 domain-containing protein [Streptomyces sp. NPDC015684]|uniref:DUF397 domain-containing protein n=1 Tax=Streptomyces sp. NPDC015684 TaxID=3364963 RepID=UPI0036FA7AF6
MSNEGLGWFKSSYSDGEGGDCVEVACDVAAVHIRDSKRQPTAPHLTVTPTAWSLFLLGEKERLRD